MKQNKYDDEKFFSAYSNMSRSLGGLDAAGEWHELKKMLPDFRGKRVLDIGCGLGWHCVYAAEQGAQYVLGTDISEKMLDAARTKTEHKNVEYMRIAMEDINFAPDSFDVVLSSLAFHYTEDFDSVAGSIRRCVKTGGDFVFSAEHPVFTARAPQSWICDAEGNRLYWAVDGYFSEGKRNTAFLGEEIVKYHRTLTTYIAALIKNGFSVSGLSEPKPDPSFLPEMQDELRRPMMLIIAAKAV